MGGFIVVCGGAMWVDLGGEWGGSQPTQNKFSELSENSEKYPLFV